MTTATQTTASRTQSPASQAPAIRQLQLNEGCEGLPGGASLVLTFPSVGVDVDAAVQVEVHAAMTAAIDTYRASVAYSALRAAHGELTAAVQREQQAQRDGDAAEAAFRLSADEAAQREALAAKGTALARGQRFGEQSTAARQQLAEAQRDAAASWRRAVAEAFAAVRAKWTPQHVSVAAEVAQQLADGLKRLAVASRLARADQVAGPPPA